MIDNISLLSSLNRVEVPIVKVTIGDYSFGVYSEEERRQGKIIRYPNYVQGVSVKKLNGQVNTYTLTIIYPITERDDPNYFEKVFSSVSKTKKIVFSYGDASAPMFLYKDEEALITDIKPNIDVQSAKITYVVTAVGAGFELNAGKYTFPARNNVKGSQVLAELLYSDYREILDVFTGMRNRELVFSKGLIPQDDMEISLNRQVNMTILDYINYVVSCMQPKNVGNTVKTSGFYGITIVDEATEFYRSSNGSSYVFDGPYFKVVPISQLDYNDSMDVYTIDIGYPSNNIITSVVLDVDGTYSILYNYSDKISKGEYVQRINDNGQVEQVFSPMLTSGNSNFITRASDKVWWTKVTEFPIKMSITLKGLLKPAIMMNYVRVNIWFYGKKFIYSGLYIILGQQDDVNTSGFRTTLQLLRVGGDNSLQ